MYYPSNIDEKARHLCEEFVSKVCREATPYGIAVCQSHREFFVSCIYYLFKIIADFLRKCNTDCNNNDHNNTNKSVSFLSQNNDIGYNIVWRYQLCLRLMINGITLHNTWMC